MTQMGVTTHGTLARCGSVGAIALFASSLIAQPVPKVTAVFPDWVQRGASSVVTLEGENLSGITGFVFSGDAGLTATNAPPPAYPVILESSRGGIAPADSDDKSLRVSVNVATDAALGPRDLRVATPAGVSGPVTLNVGFLRELTEIEPNNGTNEAQSVEWPAAISGAVQQAAESDFFRFRASKNQRLLFDAYAFRTGSPMDTSLAILDVAGRELARSEDVNGLDSLIDFTVPDDGEYFLQIRDFRYQGGKDYKYRIVAGQLPYLDSIFPLGSQRGRPVEVSLRGRNLDGLDKMKLRVDANAPLGQQEIRAHTTQGYSNPVLFDVGELPEFSESEPNNATNNANAVAVPITINGRIAGERDADQFRFKVEKDQRYIFEVFASRFGSSIDAVLALTDLNGKVIQQNDDGVGADARIEHQFGEAGEYLIRIGDLLERSGEDFAYRLSIRPPRPDFAVSFSPDTPRINRGGYAPVTVEVQRQAGFGGAVEAWLEQLPPGVTASTLLVPPDSAVSPIILLHATDDAPPGHHRLQLNSSGVINGRQVNRPGKPQSNNRPVREAFLTVLDHAPFTVEPVTLSARMEQSQSAPIEVLVRRRNGFSGDIQLSAEGYSSGKEPLSKNLEGQPVTLKGADSSATLNLKAKLDSETGTRLVFLKGEAKADGQPVIQYSRSIPLTIDPFPFTLVSSLPRLAVTAAAPEKQTAASEAQFSVKASRRGWFTEEINLSVEGVPEGISINTTNLARGAGEAGFRITATDKAPVGKEVSLTVVGTANVNGRAFQLRATPIVVTVSAPTEAGEAKPEEKPVASR